MHPVFCAISFLHLLLTQVAPPEVIVAHSCSNTGVYIGSPGIAILDKGIYLAKHDEFGPLSTEHTLAVTHVYRSEDYGNHWKRIATIRGMFWASIFVHNKAVYLLGTDKHHGNLVIRKSEDGGHTWTEPTSYMSGILDFSQYHTAPVPVVEWNGRLWRAVEDALGGTRWGERYRAMVISVPVDADLLKAENWTFSNAIGKSEKWLNGEFNGWLEGNVILTREGTLVNMLRVDTRFGGKSAIVHIEPDGKEIRFDPDEGFVDFNGGTTKFTVRYDRVSDKYWTLCNWPSEEEIQSRHAGRIRNRLVLAYSDNLREWKVGKVILEHRDMNTHGFQYADWLFEGEDIIAVVRTAYDDFCGGAHNFHDANYLTFHRIEGFREVERGN